MQFGRQDAGEDTKLKMTAMIDVVFQLLIFFLVGTKFRVPEGELEAYLPRNEGAPTTLQKRLEEVEEIRITLLIRQGGDTDPELPPSVRLDNTAAPGGIQAGSMKWLERELYRLGGNKAMREKIPVIIEAEPQLAYKWVIQTLDLCRRIGFRQVRFGQSKRNAPDPEGAGGS
jgi:biopolymer transport protein ExbD